MSNLDYELEQERRTLGTPARIAIGCALLVGVPLVLLFAYGVYIAAFQSPEDRFADMLKDKPRLAKLVEPIKRSYPTEYKRLVKKIDDANAMQLSEDELLPFIADFMTGLWSRHRDAMAQAGNPEVLALMKAQGRLAEVATRNPTICRIQFADIDFRRWNLAKDRQAKEAIYGVTMAVANAAAAGREHPTERILPSQSDQMALGRAMQARGLTNPQLAKLRQNPPVESDLEENCRTLNLVMDSVLSLPEAQIQRFGTQQMRQGGS